MAWHWEHSPDRADPNYECVTCRENGLYRNRVCKKYFPDQKPEEPINEWSPRYEALVEGNRTETVLIDDLKTKECPRSIIHRNGQMVALVKEIILANAVREATGAYPNGLDASQWSVEWFDGVVMFDAEKRRVKSAMKEAGG